MVLKDHAKSKNKSTDFVLYMYIKKGGEVDVVKDRFENFKCLAIGVLNESENLSYWNNATTILPQNKSIGYILRRRFCVHIWSCCINFTILQQNLLSQTKQKKNQYALNILKSKNSFTITDNVQNRQFLYITLLHALAYEIINSICSKLNYLSPSYLWSNTSQNK